MTDDEHAARYAALESALAELRAEVERPRVRSMRATGRCPSCNGRQLLHFKRPWTLLGSPTNAIEAFACRTCRLLEWNAISLEDIHVDETYVVQVVGPEDDATETGPYR